MYSLHTHKISRFGQWHDLESLILTSYFLKKYFIKKWYRYIFIKVFFKTNLFIWFSYFQTQQLKNYSWFIFSIFDSSLVQNDLFYEYRKSTCVYIYLLGIDRIGIADGNLLWVRCEGNRVDICPLKITFARVVFFLSPSYQAVDVWWSTEFPIFNAPVTSPASITRQELKVETRLAYNTTYSMAERGAFTLLFTRV
jgi:hypothetical protein